MKEKKYYIALDDFERRVVVNCVNEMRNKLIADGKYTDALDEVLLKVIHSKQKKLKIPKTSITKIVINNQDKQVCYVGITPHLNIQKSEE